jgi:hypothetical protein
VRYWLLAGRRAIARSASIEAINQLNQGISLVEGVQDETARKRAELDLQLAAGQAYIAARGYTAPETRAAYDRSEQLASELNDQARLYQALYGVFVGHLIAGEIKLAGPPVERLHRVASDGGDTAHVSLAYRLFGSWSFFRGYPVTAAEQLRGCLSTCGTVEQERLRWRFGPETTTAAQIFLAMTAWLLGRNEESATLSELAIADARRLNHALTIGQILALASQRCFMARDYQAMREIAADGAEYCDKTNVVYFGSICRLNKIFADAHADPLGSHVEHFRQTLKAYESANGLQVGLFRSMLAEMLLACGEAGEAAQEAQAAIARMVANDEGWWLPEAQRVLADCQLAWRESSVEHAERSYGRAVDEARRRGAIALELRAATSLARLRLSQSGTDWSGELSKTLRKFDGLMESSELHAARTLLETA